VIGQLDSAFGAAITEGDILTPSTDPNAPLPAIVVSAEALGLRTVRAGDPASDELDALDVVDDADLDFVPGGFDNCPTVVNGPAHALVPAASQHDTDTDALGVDRAEFQTTTGGQLDDDADGWGNRCDADYDNVVATVDSSDLALFKVALGKKRRLSICNPGGSSPCDVYDHDGAGPLIDSGDIAIFKTLLNKTKKADGDLVERCSTCPLTCEGDACP
jgi:hypothetical protein